MFVADLESSVNNVALSDSERELVARIKKEIINKNDAFRGVFLVAQALHRGYEPTFAIDGWHLVFEEEHEEWEWNNEEDCYDVVDTYPVENWWYPSDTAILLAYGVCTGDYSWLWAYPEQGSYNIGETLAGIIADGFPYMPCPELLPKYAEYDNDDPMYMGSRYSKRMSA